MDTSHHFATKQVVIMKRKLTKALAAALLILIVFSVIFLNPKKPVDVEVSSRNSDLYDGNFRQTATSGIGSEEISTRSKKVRDRLLGGLLTPGFAKKSCLSRFESSLYRKPSPHKPSPYLISKLRNYEKRHAQCGPNTEPFNKAVELLKSGQIDDNTECKYIVWIIYSGLGNIMLTITSAFLYALLTDRVLLVFPRSEISNLFCEPFPETSWLLPADFPDTKFFWNLDQTSPHCFWNVLNQTGSRNLPPLMYIHLIHDYDDNNKLFLCDQYQSSIEKVPWLLMKSDNYFVPSLFLMESFEQELLKLFPNKETVFHHLGRYLFHPANNVWGLITRFYNAYLAKADEIIGLQARTFVSGDDVYPLVMNQILACSQKENLLPQVKTKTFDALPSENMKSKAILVTSLASNYSENLRDMYLLHPTINGENVAVYQPSHEEFQRYADLMLDMKAWSEIYLLSLSDVLITSAKSTFGYVAQNLGGLKSWILNLPFGNYSTLRPPCHRDISIEPCFHAPPNLDCKTRTKIDTAAVVPYLQNCKDVITGVKLVNS